MKKFTLLVAMLATMTFGASNALAVCGDSVIDLTDTDMDGACEATEGCEQCDDGGIIAGDGCSATCRFECNFNTAGKKNGIKASMTRAYADCPSTQHIGFTPGATAPTCAPPVAKAIGAGTPTDRVFEEGKGSCNFATKQKALKDCSAAKAADGSNLGVDVQDPCSELTVTLKCAGMFLANGTTPVSGGNSPSWSLFTLTRATIIDSNIGPGTVVDFPVSFAVPNGNVLDGALEFTGTSSQALFAIFGSDTALSECANIEIVDVMVLQNGKPFARMGGATRPKDSIGLGI